jgi:hypothetical protein
MKKCKKCEIEKDESEFFKKKVRWLEGTCKDCKRKKVIEAIASNPEKHLEKERLRSEQRRNTQEWKVWRKDHQARKRKEISIKARSYYEDKRKNVYEKQKLWKKNNPEKVRAYIKKFKSKNPIKAAAHKFVLAALQESIITRPDKCKECMKECKPEAHHNDYLKPLDVEWLCHGCHMKRHRKFR